MNPFANLYNLVVSVFQTILDALYSVSGNYAIAIILLTILFNIVMLPMRINQSRGLKVQKLLQPRVDAINEKYKGDKERISQETMALWKKHNFNPLSGCLPLLLQFPLFFAILEVFRNIVFPEGPASAFLWIGNIAGDPDPILAILAGVASYIQSYTMSLSGPADKNTQMMTMMMPLLMVWICWSQPPSLGLYWTTNQLFYAATQYLIGRFLKVELNDSDLKPDEIKPV